MGQKRINFIPPEMAVSPKSVKLSGTINKLSMFGAVFLIVLTFSSILLFLYFSNDLKKVNASVVSLTNQISALEESEQKLILVKDKLGKISYVNSLESVEDDVIKFKALNDEILLASGSSFTQVEIIPSKTEFSLISDNSNTLTSVLGIFTKLKDYGKIVLSSLGFDPTSGFSSSYILNGK